ncbi:MAG: aspartate aminotransferase family protein [Thermoplasmata archaeon]
MHWTKSVSLAIRIRTLVGGSFEERGRAILATSHFYPYEAGWAQSVGAGHRATWDQWRGLSRSRKLWESARRLLPLGIGSNARFEQIYGSVDPPTRFIRSGEGPFVWDVDSHRLLDLHCGFGALSLGHAYPTFVDALNASLKEGIGPSYTHKGEFEAARCVRNWIPSMEMVRFCNSGTEAVVHAIRIARACQDCRGIVKFEGHYHGQSDIGLLSVDPPLSRKHKARPIPDSPGLAQTADVAVARWNDMRSLEEAFRYLDGQVAAVICEPIMGNFCATLPAPGFLRSVARFARSSGALVIFDEVKTAIRLGKDGVHERYGVRADLTAASKSISNGFPVGVLGGRAALMQRIRPGGIAHGGTYASNPLATTAIVSTLTTLSAPKKLDRMFAWGRALQEIYRRAFERNNLSFTVQGIPTMFQTVPTREGELTSYLDKRRVSPASYGRLHRSMLRAGVLIPADWEECQSVSLSHCDVDLGALESIVNRGVALSA